MSKIIILGDSLAYNRPDILTNEQRWPALLSKNLQAYQITNLSMGSSTSSRFKKLDKALFADNDILIVQIGIVDCAPRLLTRFENRVISKLPSFLSKRIISNFKRKRVQDISRVYITPQKFKENLLGLFDKFKQTRLFYIEILPASEKFLASNPRVSESINQYNLIIESCAANFDNIHLIKFDNYNIDQYTLDDGYHLNAEGHALVSKLILSVIEQQEDNNGITKD